VSLFSELWHKIKSVIPSVAAALIDVAQRGTAAIEEFCLDAARSIKKAAERTLNEFIKKLDAHKEELETFFDSIQHSDLWYVALSPIP
jgi:hypothetical protein